MRHSNLTIEGGAAADCCMVLFLQCCYIDVLKINTGGICIFPKEYGHTHFSKRLTKLKLKNCRTQEHPMMMLLETIPNLRCLCLDENAYMGAEIICSATGFPKLQTLRLYGLPNLRKWRVDEGAMPNLSELYIWGCQVLEMIPEGLIYLTALQVLSIYHMPSTFSNRIKVIGGVQGEDLYKICHIPKVLIEGALFI